MPSKASCTASTSIGVDVAARTPQRVEVDVGVLDAVVGADVARAGVQQARTVVDVLVGFRPAASGTTP
jgi:hypothetical protein